jgi:hypothetical protein
VAPLTSNLLGGSGAAEVSTAVDVTTITAVIIVLLSQQGPTLLPNPKEEVCPRVLRDGSLLDCEGDREVTMEFLMVSQNDASGCRDSPSTCGQTFIVRCDDYWSHQHGTDYAILQFEASSLDQRLTEEQLPPRGQAIALEVRRDFRCDETPYEGGFGSDCESWDCDDPECCRFISSFESLHDGTEVLLDDLEHFGSLPCLRLAHNPFSRRP